MVDGPTFYKCDFCGFIMRDGDYYCMLCGAFVKDMKNIPEEYKCPGCERLIGENWGGRCLFCNSKLW